MRTRPRRGAARATLRRRLAGPRPRPSHPRCAPSRGCCPTPWTPIDDASLDVVLCMSVLEHLWEPEQTLDALPPRAAPGRRVRGQRAVVARQARPGVLRLPARPLAGRGDGRPQDVLRPARPVAAAGARPASCHTPSGASATSSASTPSRSAPSPEHRIRSRMTFTEDFLAETVAIWSRPSTRDSIESDGRRASPRSASAGGRLFILGVGGSAGHASHAVNDFRKICELRGLRPDRQRLRAHRPHQRRGLGHHVRGLAATARGSTPTTPCWSSRSAAATPRRSVSANIVPRLELAKERGAVDLRHRRPRRRLHRRSWPTPASIIPPLFAERITPHTEGLCAVVWHLLVSHPALAATATKWESRACERPASSARSASSAAPGFIGSHFVDRLLADPATEQVTVYDNFSSGRDWHLEPVTRRPAARRVVRGDVDDLAALTEAMRRPRRGHPPGLQPRHRGGGHRTRPSTSTRARCSPTTSSRRCGVAGVAAGALRVAAAASTATSASSRPHEDHGPLVPDVDLRREQAGRRGADRRRTPPCSTSPSGAFRFGNVVGPRQTHGVGFDFVRRLLEDPTAAAHPGRRHSRASPTSTSTTSSTPCCWPADWRTRPFDAFNVATGDYITVTEIAELAMRGARPRARVDDVRVHRRRPRLEGRRARRAASTTGKIRVAGLGATSAPAARRCATR